MGFHCYVLSYTRKYTIINIKQYYSFSKSNWVAFYNCSLRIPQCTNVLFYPCRFVKIGENKRPENFWGMQGSEIRRIQWSGNTSFYSTHTVKTMLQKSSELRRQTYKQHNYFSPLATDASLRYKHFHMWNTSSDLQMWAQRWAVLEHSAPPNRNEH